MSSDNQKPREPVPVFSILFTIGLVVLLAGAAIVEGPEMVSPRGWAILLIVTGLVVWPAIRQLYLAIFRATPRDAPEATLGQRDPR